MSEEESLPPHVKFWLSPDSNHDCHFIVGSASGPKMRIGSFKHFLIGYSEYFKAMLKNRELTEQGDISIVDIQPDTFTHFLKCLYMNCQNVTEGKLSFQNCVDLLQVANMYMVTYLKEKLVDYMLHTLQNATRLEDIFIVLSNPVVLQEKHLEDVLCKIIPYKIKEIFSSSSFLSISSESLLWILKLDDVGADEITIWREVLKWATYKTNSVDGVVLRQYMLKHLHLIRFCTMSHDDFCKLVVPTDILTHTEVYEVCMSMGRGKLTDMKFICNNKILRQGRDKKPVGSTYLFCANNIKDLTEMSSELFTLWGLKWSVLVQKNGEFLALYLICEGSNPTADEKRSVKVEFVLISHGGNNISKSFSMVYNEVPNWGFTEFWPWKEIMDPSNKYVLYNSITILVCIN